MKSASKVIRHFLTYCVLLSGLSGALNASTYVVDQADKRASDNNLGTLKAPFKTISAAAKAAKPGDAIVVKSGIYRETVVLPKGSQGSRVTLKAWPGHRPIVKGSELLRSTWRKARIAIKYRPGQDKRPVSTQVENMVQAYFDSLSKKPESSSNAEWQGEDPEVPFAGIYACEIDRTTQMVFADEQPLKQIGPFSQYATNNAQVDGATPEDMRPGTFFFDLKSKTLYIWLKDGEDPSKHVIEYSIRDDGIKVGEYSTLSGFTVKHCQHSQSPSSEKTGIHASGKGIVIENCTAVHNDFAGIVINGEDCVVRGCEMAYNGSNGFISSIGKRMRFEKNIIHNNNTRKYANGGISGGVKIHLWEDSSCTGNTVWDDAPGLWFDIGNKNILIAENRLSRCPVGIYYEISRWGIIVNNTLRDCDLGIWSYSSDVLIANNIVDRCPEGIQVWGELREAARSCIENDVAMSSVRNNLIVNNIVIDATGCYIGISDDSDHCSNNLSDYNVFVSTGPAHRGTNHIKFMGNIDKYYGRLQFWQMQRSCDLHSTIADADFAHKHTEGRTWNTVKPEYIVSNPGFVNRDKGDYRLRPDSPLRGKGIEVPMVLDSVYYQGREVLANTLLNTAPNPSSTTTVYELAGKKHYRIQPEPLPLAMFDPVKQPTAYPGLNQEWTKTSGYPSFKINERPKLNDK